MVEHREAVHIQQTKDDAKDEWVQWHLCPKCEALETGQTEAKVMEDNFERPIEHKKLRVQRYQEALKRNTQEWQAVGSKGKRKKFVHDMLVAKHVDRVARDMLEGLVAKDVDRVAQPSRSPRGRPSAESIPRCIICLSNTPTFECMPCHHCCICSSCRNDFPYTRCPICRSVITSVDKVYFS